MTILALVLAVVFNQWTYGDGVVVPVTGALPPSDRLATVLTACRDEWVSFQLVITNNREVPLDLTIASGDFFGPSPISRDFVDFYIQHPIFVSSVHPPQGSLPPGWYYERMAPQIYPQVLTVPARGRRALWYDLHVPRGALPGDYLGAVIVAGGGAQGGVFVRLKVLDLTLTRSSTPLVAGFSEVAFKQFHRPSAPRGAGGDPREYWDNPVGLALLQSYLDMAEAHGVTLAMRGFLPRDWREYPRPYGLWQSYDAFFGPWIARSPVWLVPHPPHFRGDLSAPGDSLEVSRWFGEIERHWREKGWPLDRAFAWVHDEPRNGHVVPAATVARYREIIRQAAPGLNVLVAESVEDSAFVPGGNWIASKADKLYPPEIRGLKLDGRLTEAWLYQGYNEPAAPLETIHARPPGFRGWGAILWKYRATVDGGLYWSVNHWHPTDPFNIPDAAPDRYGDGQGTGMWPDVQAGRRLKDMRWASQFLALCEMAPAALADSVVNSLVQSALCASYRAETYPTGSHYIGPRVDPRYADGRADWVQDPRAWNRAAARLRQR